LLAAIPRDAPTNRSYFTQVMKAAAARHCGGKLLFLHEGGYSAFYVPFCGLAVMEELSGVKTAIVDAELEEHGKVGWYRVKAGSFGLSATKGTGVKEALAGRLPLSLSLAPALSLSEHPLTRAACTFYRVAPLLQRWGMQGLQPWQDARIAEVEAGPLALLKAKHGKQQNGTAC
jgi:hypothetical protein